MCGSRRNYTLFTNSYQKQVVYAFTFPNKSLLLHVVLLVNAYDIPLDSPPQHPKNCQIAMFPRRLSE